MSNVKDARCKDVYHVVVVVFYVIGRAPRDPCS